MKLFLITIILLLTDLDLFASFSDYTKNEIKLLDQGKVILREINIKKKYPQYEAAGIINAPKEALYSLLQSYEKYPEFMPNVEKIEIKENDKSFAVLDYTLKLPMGIRRYFTVKITYDLSPSILKLYWQMLENKKTAPSKTIDDTTGHWLLSDYKENMTLVVYNVYTDPGKIPLGMGWITKFLTEKSIPAVIQNTKEYIEKQIK